jgi:hypothetical protein
MFSLQQNQRTRGQNWFCLRWGEMAQTMYRHVSKCKNDKIKGGKKRLKKVLTDFADKFQKKTKYYYI